ncbi:hypothetical protein C8R43DRAFT_1079192 [Mycena crocata]|nr:hypothetical protein C8R43DRAFT_1079192 [Mycena crocata]
MFFYFIFTLPSALAKNAAILVISRQLAGLAASAPMCSVGGSVATRRHMEYRRARDPHGRILCHDFFFFSIRKLNHFHTLPFALFIFAFTGGYSWVNFMGPCVAGTLLGFSMILIYVSANSYIVDLCSAYAASAIAAKTIMRSLISAAVPLYVDQMFAHMGFQWAGLLLALVSAVIAPIPFVFYVYGYRIRMRSEKASKDRRMDSDSNSESEMGGRGMSVTEVKTYMCIQPKKIGALAILGTS